jgi:hypothetical protein
MRPMDINRHLDAEEIESYSLQTTPESDVARVEEHLLVCTECQKRVESSDVFVSAMQDGARDLRKKKAPAPRPLGFRLPLFALAFAVALAVVGIVFPRHTGEIPPSAVPVTLSAMRGTAGEAKAPAGKLLKLQLDLTGIPQDQEYLVEVVDQNGKVVTGAYTPDTRIRPLLPGIYFVRLFSRADELLREYALQVEAAK